MSPRKKTTAGLPTVQAALLLCGALLFAACGDSPTAPPPRLDPTVSNSMVPNDPPPPQYECPEQEYYPWYDCSGSGGDDPPSDGSGSGGGPANGTEAACFDELAGASDGAGTCSVSPTYVWIKVPALIDCPAHAEGWAPKVTGTPGTVYYDLKRVSDVIRRDLGSWGPGLGYNIAFYKGQVVVNGRPRYVEGGVWCAVGWALLH